MPEAHPRLREALNFMDFIKNLILIKLFSKIQMRLQPKQMNNFDVRRKVIKINIWPTCAVSLVNPNLSVSWQYAIYFLYIRIVRFL